MDINLYNSKICRLCGEKSENGVKLYILDERDVSQLINRYLPLKISDDGQYPRWICPGCHLQVESTVEFFDLVISGQTSLRIMLNDQGKANNDNLKKANLFSDDHTIHARLGTMAKEKRKRGRPSKSTTEKLKEKEVAEEASKMDQLNQAEAEDLLDDNAEGRRKRKIKLPSRFRGVVQGRELERIYVEKGVIDKSDSLSDIDCTFTKEPDVCDFSEGVIGHMEDTDGSHVVDLIFDSSKSAKKYSHSGHKKKFICEICSRSYTQQSRYISHKLSHHNVQYECIQCLEKFSTRTLITEHQQHAQHIGVGIIENLETETNVELQLPNEQNIKNEVQDSIQTTLVCDKTSEELNDVFDEIDNMEEAARVLYGLQNIDRIDSPQPFSVTIRQSSANEITSEFLDYTNFITEKKPGVDRIAFDRINDENAVNDRENTQSSSNSLIKRSEQKRLEKELHKFEMTSDVKHTNNQSTLQFRERKSSLWTQGPPLTYNNISKHQKE